MAIRKIGEGVNQWTNKIEFPKDRYSLTCIEEEFGMSKSSGSPMITRVWEIVAPELVTVGDRTVSVAGAKITQYRPTKIKSEDKESWDSERSDKAFGTFSSELLACGYSEEDIDDENPPLFMKGKTVDAVVYGKKDVSRKSPTAEQKKSHQPGDAIKDADGKEVISYQLNIETILGLSVQDVAM